MKKNLFAILMCLMLVCSGMALAEEAAPDLTGVWTLDSITVGEMAISPSMMGLELFMTVNADNTVVFNSNGEESTGTWTQEGNVLTTIETVGDAQIITPYTYADGQLTTFEESMGATLYFVQGAAEEEAAPAPVAIAAESAADFNGTWNLTTAEMMGIEVPVAMMGVGMQFEIADGVITGSATQTAEDGTITTAPVDAIKAEFADGALVIAAPEGVDIGIDELKLQLRSDGKMFFSVEQDGMLINFLFDKVVAE